MLAEQLLRILTGVFVGIYIARYLGPEQFGVLSYVLAISAFVLAIARLGMDAVLVRELVEAPDQREILVGTAFWLMLSSAAVCYAVVGAAVYFLAEAQMIKLYILIVSASAFFTSFMVVDYHFQSELNSKYSAICKACTLAVMSIAKIILIVLGVDLTWFVIAALMDHIILALFMFFAVRKLGSLAFIKSFSGQHAIAMLHSAWPMVLTAVAALIYMRIDQVMIRNMLGFYEAGLYSAAVKIYESWIVLPFIITTSLLPAIVKLKQGNDYEYRRRMSQLLSILIWGSVFAAVVVFFVGEHLMVLAFGDAYKDSAAVLSIVMWTAVFASIGSLSARYFNAERMEKKIALRTALAAMLNVGLNLILIPMYGIKGAAIATLFCTFFANYLMDWFDKDLRILLEIKHRALFSRGIWVEKK